MSFDRRVVPKESKKNPDHFCQQIAEYHNTEVCRMDRPGPGGAPHQYEVFTQPEEGELALSLCRIHFQEGPIKESGVNGVQQEDLIEILIDRLTHYQDGQYACEENAAALLRLQDAKAHLFRRTARRTADGTEGTPEGN